MNFKNWQTSGLRSLALLIVIGIIIILGRILHIKDITWALISGVICSEIEIDRTHSVVLLRILETTIGVSFASLILIIIGPGYFGLIIDVIGVALICNSTSLLSKNSWKLATATSLIVLIAGLQQHSIYLGVITALKRAGEVILGSLTAGVVIFIIRELCKPYFISQKKP